MRNLGQYVGGVVVTPPDQLSIIRVRNVTKFEHQEATNLILLKPHIHSSVEEELCFEHSVE